MNKSRVLAAQNWHSCSGTYMCALVETMGGKREQTTHQVFPNFMGGRGRDRRMKSSKEEYGTARRKSRTFSKPNCFSSAMETVEWMSSWATEADVDACCGVANGIHFAAFPIAMLCGGRAEGSKGKGREGGYQRHVDGDTDDSVVYVEDDRLQRGRAPLCYVNGPRTSWLRPQAGLATHSSPSNLIPRNRQPATTRPHLSSTLLGPSLSPYFSQYLPE